MELPIIYYGEESWSKALLIYDSALKEINTKIEILNNEFKLKHQYNPIEHVSSRLKSPDSISKKLQRKGRAITIENVLKYVNDVAGVRIICSFTSDIYKIAKLIARQSDVEVIKVKDYIASPKPNGYMSYHMIVTVPIFLSNKMVKTNVEIQIRTIAMDFWASLEHKMYYKFEGNGPEHIRRELKECADIVNYLDRKMLSINEEIQTYKEEQDSWKENKNIKNDSFFETVNDSSYEESYEESNDGVHVEAHMESHSGLHVESYAGTYEESYGESYEKIYVEVSSGITEADMSIVRTAKAAVAAQNAMDMRERQGDTQRTVSEVIDQESDEVETAFGDTEKELQMEEEQQKSFTRKNIEQLKNILKKKNVNQASN